MKDWLDKLAAAQPPTIPPAGYYTSKQIAQRLGISEAAAYAKMRREKAKQVKVKVGKRAEFAFRMV